jgi:predicted Ser/Thr protein kinase
MIVGQNYKIVSELGAGGMGVVYQAVDLTLEREVALKKLRSEFSRSADVAERFRAEAKIQARMNHAGIAQLYTMFKDGDVFYMAMEFVNGSPLNALVPQPWDNAVSILLQVLESLDYAHSLGVLHRDIKPENIVVNPKGIVKVMDFGIAHVLGSTRLTREKSIIGTPEYMAPERITGGEMDRRSDVYSLGILLFELVAGRLPFASASEFELLKHQIETPLPELRKLRDGVPEFVEKAACKAAAKNPADRYATCKDMAGELRAGAIAEMGSAWMDVQARLGSAAAKAGGVARWQQRVEALVSNGEIEVARRVLSTAQADFGNDPALKICEQLIDTQRTRKATGGGSMIESERNRYVREMLIQLADCEREQTWDRGLELADQALQQYPGVRALALAKWALEQKQSRG